MISQKLQSFILVLLIAGSILLPMISTVWVASPALADTQADEQQIRQAVVTALTHPGQPADANPRATHVAIVGEYALADWLLAEAGGEMLLMRQQGKWQKVAQTGGVMNSTWLMEQGVPEAIAVQLVQTLQAQWKH